MSQAFFLLLHPLPTILFGCLVSVYVQLEIVKVEPPGKSHPDEKQAVTSSFFKDHFPETIPMSENP